MSVLLEHKKPPSTWLGAPAKDVSFCLLYTSDAADERSSVDLGGRRIIKKKNTYKKEEERILCIDTTQQNIEAK